MASNAGFVGLFNAVNGIIEVQTLLVFLLVFTLIYAILQKTKIIGEGKKNFNLVVSLVVSLFTVIPHVLGTVTPEHDPVLIIAQALPNVSVVIVAILGALLLIGVFGSRMQIAGTSVASIVAILAFAAVVFIFGASAGWWNNPSWLSVLQDQDTQSVVITVLVFAVVIWFITSDDDARVGGGFGDMLKGIRDSIK